MAPTKRPTLIILAGPNGSGKSTLYATRIAPTFSAPFINADIIQRDELGESDMNAAYKAAQIASDRRDTLLAERRSFATETVFSDPSKLDLIEVGKRLGYRVMLFHVCVEDPDLSVARVTERVKEGGHPVPEEKVRQRYDRNGPLIRQAAHLSDIAHIFDNSKLNHPPERVLTFTGGKPSFVAMRLPGWALRIYGSDLVLGSE